MLDFVKDQESKPRERVTQPKSEQFDVTQIMERAMQVSVPYWPLQNTVAVNPFWNLRKGAFHTVVENLFSVTHTPLYMPLEYYVDMFERGRINRDRLAEVLKEASEEDASLPGNVEDFLEQCQRLPFSGRRVFCLAEFTQNEIGGQWHRQISDDCSKHAAAYFDGSQALAKHPWRKSDFLSAWFKIQSVDKTMLSHGMTRFHSDVSRFSGKSAEEVIALALSSLGVRNSTAAVAYLRRLIVSNFGWFSQFGYVEWQKSLGYTVDSKAASKDFLAVKLIYEAALADWLRIQRPVIIENWQQSLKANASTRDEEIHGFRFHRVWLRAFERTYQASVAKALRSESGFEASPRYQLAFCIDVRSEMFRRNLESVSRQVRTIGFAGFFGIAAQFQRADEKEPVQLCPVLLTPAVTVKDVGGEETSLRWRLGKTLARGYFKNLRKGLLSSFLYVEVFGIVSLFSLLKKAFSRGGKRAIPARFDPRQSQPIASFGTVDERADRAAGVLRHMGLTRDFAPLVVIVGHGSQTTNNAFGSALDCGACGGHAGDINARVLAQLLNDPEVRTALAKDRGIAIPEETWFCAGVHETVTDTLHLLDNGSIPDSHAVLVKDLGDVLQLTAARTRREREFAVSIRPSETPQKRSANWAEVRPEWGLSNNACFIVAPRSRTHGVNLGSRSFLHDYDWKNDSGFKTLELIMTAPMVVTNWINLQYYASAVAPGIYGAGNKLLHNLVNECGVLEGNGGDLRVGLPFQSVHDGRRPVHEPLRLSVFIEAPRSEIEDIIRRHANVKDLVDNGWLNLLHIEPETGKVFYREGEFYTLLT